MKYYVFKYFWGVNLAQILHVFNNSHPKKHSGIKSEKSVILKICNEINVVFWKKKFKRLIYHNSSVNRVNTLFLYFFSFFNLLYGGSIFSLIKLSVMHYFSSRTQKQQSKIQILILKEKHLKKNFYIPEIIKQCTKELWEEIQLLKHLKIDLRCKQKLGISHVKDHISPIRFRCTVAENRQQSRAWGRTRL